MKIKLFETLCGTSLGTNHFTRGLIIDGKEITTSHETVKTGDIRRRSLGRGYVRSTLINHTNNKPTHCPLAIEMRAALTKSRRGRS